MPKNPSSNPLTNWRWFAAFIPTAIIMLVAAILTAGKIIGYFSEWAFSKLHNKVLRPIVQWTWGYRS